MQPVFTERMGTSVNLLVEQHRISVHFAINGEFPGDGGKNQRVAGSPENWLDGTVDHFEKIVKMPPFGFVKGRRAETHCRRLTGGRTRRGAALEVVVGLIECFCLGEAA